MNDTNTDDRPSISANPLRAIGAAVRDIRRGRVASSSSPADDVRVDGKTCLVTGANSGLGRAAAIELARRGAHVILACRPGHADTRSEIMQLSGSSTVDMMEVDLADLRSVHQFCDRLARQGTRIDVALLNAGLAAGRSRPSRQGYDLMFAVHFLANRVMIDRWLGDGVIQPAGRSGAVPRIVFVTSESHRSAPDIDFERFGAYVEYGIRNGLSHYGLSKLVQCTFATELSRRLNPDDEVQVAVHAICPGGVATNISREAPRLLRPSLDVILRRCFQSPEEAVAPLIHLCGDEEAGKSTGLYLHMAERSAVSARASNRDQGRRLWEASEALLAEHRPRPPSSGVCVWFTGLSGSGKSTTAAALVDLLEEHGRRVTVLDGDEVRQLLSKGLGFSREDRDDNIRRIGYVAGQIVHHGGVAICAAVSPYAHARDEVRGMIGPDRFIEVFVDTPLEVCEERDPKGLYQRARRGEVANFTGIDDPYEVPERPEIVLQTIDHSASDNARTVLDDLAARGFVRIEDGGLRKPAAGSRDHSIA